MGPHVTMRLGRLLRSNFKRMKYVSSSLKNIRRFFWTENKMKVGFISLFPCIREDHVQLHRVPSTSSFSTASSGSFHRIQNGPSTFYEQFTVFHGIIC